MTEPFDFDSTLLGELIARRWQEDRGYYTLNSNANGGWLKALWKRRAGHGGLELHWTRRGGPYTAAELAAPA